MDAVFIVGCMRTGSKIYMNVFRHTHIDMSPELHFMNPSWLHRDFVSVTRNKIGNLCEDKNVDDLVNLMYSNRYYGTFWKHIKFDPCTLRHNILRSDRTFRSIFDILLKEHANYKQKKICGAKFPTHFSYVPTLMKWYPNCKIIHIFRDPRAVFASQIAKNVKRRHNRRVLVYIPILIHTVLQSIWSFRVYDAHKDLRNYYGSLYEDVVTNPEKSLNRICNFLEIDFSENMLNMRVKDSSFMTNKWGITNQSKDRWKRMVSPATSNLIRLLTKKQMRKFGYS